MTKPLTAEAAAALAETIVGPAFSPHHVELVKAITADLLSVVAAQASIEDRLNEMKAQIQALEITVRNALGGPSNDADS